MKPTMKHIIKNQDVVSQPSVLRTIPHIVLNNNTWYRVVDIAKKMGIRTHSKPFKPTY